MVDGSPRIGESDDRDGLPLEVLAVWLLYAVVSLEVLVTYWRVGAGELYSVSGSGLAGGASRVLVLLNYPIALVAIAVLILLADRRGGLIAGVAMVGIVLCAAVAWPGVVDQSDLDARPVNAIAAIGVADAVVLSLVVWRRGSVERVGPRAGDRVRVMVAAVVLLAAVPWMLADLGVSLDHVPVLGSIYQTGELRAQPGNPTLHPAVHHGHHHGMDGALLVLTALLLSRVLPRTRTAWGHRVAGVYLALMLCYGATIMANDFWLEQIVKRGWTSWEIPDATTPSVTPVWGVVIAATVVLLGVSRWRVRHPARSLPLRSVTS